MAGSSEDMNLGTNLSQMDSETQCSFQAAYSTPGWEALMFNFVFMMIVSLFGLIGNAMSFVVFSTFKSRTSTFTYLRALTCVDFCVIALTNLFEHRYIYPFLLPGSGRHELGTYDLTIGGQLALIVLPLAYTASTASAWIIVLVSVDRFIIVCHPTKAKPTSKRRDARKWLFVLFCCSALYNLPRFFEYYPLLKRLDVIDKCTGYFSVPADTLGGTYEYIWVYSFTLYVLLMYLLPLCILSFVGYRLLLVVRHQKKMTQVLKSKVAGAPQYLKAPLAPPKVSGDIASDKSPTAQQALDRPKGTSASVKKKKKKLDYVTIQLVAISSVYAFCQSFDMILQILWRINAPVAPDYSIWSYNLIVINSAVNVIIYSMGGAQFRRRLLKIVCWLVPSWGDSSEEATHDQLTPPHPTPHHSQAPHFNSESHSPPHS